MRKATNFKVDWLRLEQYIRKVLKNYHENLPNLISADLALHAIDDALGEETGRGFVFDHPKDSEYQKAKEN